uniref:Isochorismatase-like domain-containing protein n=1 Tax=Zea mays TaxID=4577 RepID=A0A804NT19_MAIZE
MGTEADAAAVDLLRSQIPFQTDGEFVLPPRGVGLVLVDLCNGFCTVGAGNLAPVAPNKQISKMVEEAARLSKLFCDRNLPIFAFLDTHYPDKPEPPYPPHCIIGTGEEDFVPDLEWLEKEPNVTIKRKSCIDGYISCIEKDGSSVFADWIGKYQIKTDVVIYSGGCATYDLPVEIATNIKGALAHPQDLMHHIGLYMAKGRGAKIVDRVVIEP